VLGDTLGGHDRTRLEEYLDPVEEKTIDLKAVSQSGGSESGGGRLEGKCVGS